MRKIAEHEKNEPDKRLKERLTHIKKKIMVMSGN